MGSPYGFPETGADWQALRERYGLSRVRLAQRAHVDPSTVWELEHDGSVSVKVRLLIGAALGLEVFAPLEGAAA